MITLKDLNLLINHLHHANQIFDTEAIIEERKHHDPKYAPAHDMRDKHAPRSVILHHKAEQVSSLEKKLLQECDTAILHLEENTIYAARELIAESVYPWINRKEPTLKCINDLIADETFIPFGQGLAEKKKKLLSAGIHILMLPQEIENDIHTYFTREKAHSKNDVTVTVSDIISFDRDRLITIFTENSDYRVRLLLFRLYTLGLIENIPSRYYSDEPVKEEAALFQKHN